MKPLALMIGLFGAAMLSCVCDAQILDNPFAEYFERGVTISPYGGNAKDANAAIHTIDPWPPYAGNTRISQEGRAAVNAVERMYTKCDPFPQAATLGGGTGGTGSTSGGGSTGGATVGAGGEAEAEAEAAAAVVAEAATSAVQGRGRGPVAALVRSLGGSRVDHDRENPRLGLTQIAEISCLIASSAK